MPSSTRQLAAIMFTDIVGYTKLMQESERQAVNIRQRHRDIFNDCNSNFNGKIIQYYGDGTLSIFTSAVDAVNCAHEMQLMMRKEPIIPLRIGIHLGDILLSENDIIGNSVNIASRVESLGTEGAVLISDKIVEEIKNQDELPYVFLGSFQFKNDEKKRDVFALTCPGLVIPDSDQIEGKIEKPVRKNEIRSLAVLPFDNFTGDTAQSYLVSGLHDNLITFLSQIGSLRVISKTSTLPFKNTTKSIPEIATELNVDAIVEASVNMINEDVQLNIQMIRAFPIEDHIWANVYSNATNDIFTLFSDVTKAIASKIDIDLTKKEDHNLSSVSSIEPEAYKAYLKGMFHWEKLSAKDFELANEYFEKSIELDAEFAPAYAAIANTLLGQVQMGLTSPIEAIPKIYRFNQQALAINPDFSDAHYMAALLSMAVEWDWEKSEKAFHNALTANTNSSLANAYYGHLLMVQKSFDEALERSNKAQSLDPNNPLIQSLAGIVFFHLGDIKKAHDLGNASFQIDPNNILTLRLLEMTNYALEKFDNAYNLQKKILANEPSSIKALEKGYKEKNYQYALKLAAQNKEKLAVNQYVQPVWIAYAFVRIGEYESAINWLEKGYQMHDQDMPYVFVVKEFDPIRKDPRFIGLAKKMNLPI